MVPLWYKACCTTSFLHAIRPELHIKFGVPHYTLLNKVSLVRFHQARLVENKAPCHLGRATVNILDNDVPTNKLCTSNLALFSSSTIIL